MAAQWPAVTRVSATSAVLALAAALVLCAPGCGKKSVTRPEPPPSCEVTPTTLDFGDQVVGTSGDTLVFTIKNTGGGTLTARVRGACGTFAVACGCGHISLKGGESQDVLVRFHPTAAGHASCEFVFGDSVTCSGVTCTGNGILQPACQLSRTELVFPDQLAGTCGDPQSFTITNSGGATLTGTLPATCGGFTVVAGSGPFSLEAGQTRPVSVEFCPTVAGPTTCDLALGGNVTCAALHLSGTAISPQPVCQVTPATLPFGSVVMGGCSDELPFMITNTGAGTLTGTVPASCGLFTVTSGSGPFSLPTGHSWSATAKFCPTAAGASSCDMSFGGNVTCPPMTCVGTGTCNGTITVTSTPPGAIVVVDGADIIPRTPCELTLAQGPHKIYVHRTGYAYFAPSDLTVSPPCTGTTTVNFVGHHITRITADRATWISQAAPAQNFCDSTYFVIGEDAQGNNNRAALIHVPVQPSYTMSVYAAALIIHQSWCSPLAATPMDIVAYPATEDWAPCVPTWNSPVGRTDVKASPATELPFCTEYYWHLDVTGIVTDWVNNLPNYGWVIAAPYPPVGPAIHYFDGINGTKYPYVELDYTDK
jgi:hypothetical protein